LNQTNLEAHELNTCAPQCFLPNALLQEVAETTKSLQADLSNPLLYLQRARALARLGRQEEAIRDLTRAIDYPAMLEESLLAELFDRRADAYLSVGQQQEAKEDYAVAAEIYFSLNRFEQWQTCRDKAE
jgi:tetratricopeptide (TPR) repeat protein